MKLDILPGGDMALAQRSVLFRHSAQGVEGARGKDAAGDFDPNHLDIGLPLAVHALAQPKGRELGIILFPGLETRRLRLKPLHFVLHKGNDAGRGRGQLHTAAVDFLLSRRLGRFAYRGQRGLLELAVRSACRFPGQFLDSQGGTGCKNKTHRA